MKRILMVLVARVGACLFLLPFLSQSAHGGSGGTVSAWGGGQPNFPAGLTTVTAISTSADHSLALNTNGTVTAWGCDYDGQCDVPGGLNTVTAVAAGDFFSLALLSNGTVVAWGTDDKGQCDVPSGLNNVVKISAGHAHSLAVQANGTVVSWGWGAFGQTSVPAGLQNPSQIVAAGNYSMALTTNGAILAWGVDDTGQTNVPGGLTGVTEIAGAKGYCLAVENNGTVTAWGSPPTLPSLNNVVVVAAGEYHGLALTSSGTVVEWGSNVSGEGAVPSGLSNVTSLAAGWEYSLTLAGGSIILSAVNLTHPVLTGNTFSVSFQSQNGASYTLQYTTSLAPTNWTAVPSGNGNGTGGSMTLSDTSATDPQRFYRVWVQ